MNIFEFDYLGAALILLKEAFSFKKYKAMHPVLAVFTGIFMIPFVLSSMISALVLILTAFFFKVNKLPIDFLHGMLKSEGKDVHPATQFIIYFFSWPVIFALYASLSLSLLAITALYAGLSLETYVWSLGGYRFHAMIGTFCEDMAIRVRINYRPSLPLVFIIVCAVILAVEAVLFFTGKALVLIPVLFLAYIVFATVYVAVAMTKNASPADGLAPDFLSIERIDV